MNESTEDLKPGEGQTPEDVNSQAGSLEASSNDVTPEQAEEAKRKSQEDINRATNKAINKKHRQMREAQEAADRERQKNAELQAKLDEFRSQNAPEIPPVPDTFDPEYAQKMHDRDAALQQKAQYDQAQQYAQQEQQRVQQQQAQQAQDQVAKSVQTYQQNVKTLNIDEVEMAKDEQVVATYIQDPSIRNFLLQDADGPLYVQYLANNAVEMDRVASMDAVTAGIYLTNTVGEKVRALKPNASQTPDPLVIPGGRSAPKQESPFLRGATFE